ncbi:MAG: fused MFS/spermidine synthase, partial [Deltaproteobacteria bacterium]
MKNRSILFAFFLSGMATLIHEVAWVRPIGFVYDSTIFVVSAITASLMGGLALGSLLAGRFFNRLKRPMFVYAMMELGIGIYGILLIELVKFLPAVNEHLLMVTSLLQYNTMIFGSVFLLLLIPTTLMGATFPTVVQAYLSEKIGRGIGELYSANNIGAIIGSLLAGFILIPTLGIKGSILLAAVFNLSAALLVLNAFHRRELRLFAPIAGLLFFVLAFISHYDVTTLFSQGPFGLYKQEYLGEQKVVFYREG